MRAKIYQPAPSAMTSGQGQAEGRGQSGQWHMKFISSSVAAAPLIDPLTGTRISRDMNKQIELVFDTLDAAVQYAKKHKMAHRVIQPKTARRIVRSYGDNFAFERRLPWTH